MTELNLGHLQQLFSIMAINLASFRKQNYSLCSFIPCEALTFKAIKNSEVLAYIESNLKEKQG